MNALYVILREIRFRKHSFVVGVLAVAAAVAVFMFSRLLLLSHDAVTEDIIAKGEQVLAADLEEMENQVRKSMEKLGFNITILPENQDLGDYYSDDYAKETMPEEYAEKLETAGLMTIEKLTPRLRAKIKWPEKEITVIILGEPGLKPGEVRTGHEISRSLGILPGQEITVIGMKLKNMKCMPEKGTSEDSTLFMNLETAQDLLDKPGRINEIIAVECRTSLNRLGKVREEISSILPGMQVLEKGTSTIASKEALESTEKQRRSQLDSQAELRQDLRSRREQKGLMLGAVTAVAAFLILAYLAIRNVRQRKIEIGTYRAIGNSGVFIFRLLLTRTVLIGLAGGCMGILLSVVIALFIRGTGSLGLSPGLMFWVLCSAILAGTVSGLIPVMTAVYRDPADVLREP